MKTTTICQGCWEQMHVPIPIRGPFSFFFRPFGIKKSQMHPNLCTICESMFMRVKKKKQIEISTTILFADLRGYTHLSQHLDATKMNELLHCFYDNCSEAIWEKEGIVNKFIGDAVLAIFNFPLERQNHVQNAVHAAIQLQKRCKKMNEGFGLGDEHEIGIGVGIHTGQCTMGQVGNAYKDFTAIGPVVNLASRLQGAAGPGQILVTESVFSSVKDEFPFSTGMTMTLKGVNHPITGYVINMDAHAGFEA